jgi:hypothetical protein
LVVGVGPFWTVNGQKALMGNKSSSADSSEGRLTKKGTFLNCACAKGKEETDGFASSRGKVTKLTEEEWAAVKAGRVSDNAKQPDLLAEEMFPSTKPESKKPSSNSDSKSSNGHSHKSRTTDIKKPDDSVENEVKSSSASDSKSEDRFQNLRFKVGDRVRCVCSRYGNKHEAGSVIKIGFREKDWPSSKPSAPYQGTRLVNQFHLQLTYFRIIMALILLNPVKLDKGALIYAPEDRDEYITYADEEWAKQLPAGSPWYLHPGALDRELAKMGVHR